LTICGKISSLLRNPVIYGLVFLSFSDIVFTQNFQVADSVKAQSSFSSITNLNKISSQKPSENFYKTDSIFSFYSPKGYFPSLILNFVGQATAPSEFKTKQWLIAGAAVGITAALIHVDNEIDDWARTQKQNHKWINKTSPVITQFGSNYGVCTVLATGLISAIFKNQKGVQTSLLATQAMITSGIWVQIIKQLTGRERPMVAYINSKAGGGQWNGPFAQFDQDLAVKEPGLSFDSFPSGHTAAAFSIASVFASQYSDTKAIPVISYSVATLVGISRLTEHRHWASDVFAGAFIGYLCGKEVVSNFNKTHQNAYTTLLPKLKHKTEFTFIQDENQIGFSLKW
jgi:membrane-associated phospholipid phosphatase